MESVRGPWEGLWEDSEWGEGPGTSHSHCLLLLHGLGGSQRQSRVWLLQLRDCREGRRQRWLEPGVLSGKALDFATVSHLSLEGYPQSL